MKLTAHWIKNNSAYEVTYKPAALPTPPNIREVRKIGDPIMAEYGYSGSFDNFNTRSNFQAISTYDQEHDSFGGLGKHFDLTQSDLDRIRAIQVEDSFPASQKMQYLIGKKGTVIYQQKNAPYSLGSLVYGRYVWVQAEQWLPVRLPKQRSKRNVRMARLRGFARDDWDLLLTGGKKRPDFDKQLARLVSWGLVHEVWCTYAGGVTRDVTPKGKIYLPFFSPREWALHNTAPTDLWLPVDHLL